MDNSTTDPLDISFRKICSRCKVAEDIAIIFIEPEHITYEFSCGQRDICITLEESIGVSDSINAKHFNSLEKLLERYKTKTSRETNRPARDIIKIDRQRGKRIHSVEEQGENGDWSQVHYHEDDI